MPLNPKTSSPYRVNAWVHQAYLEMNVLHIEYSSEKKEIIFI
jgi:hypothetical protein